MQTHLVFTVIAEDRAGLVERIAEEIAASGGNWVESSMARLGGEFAGIVRVTVPGWPQRVHRLFAQAEIDLSLDRCSASNKPTIRT